MTPSTATRAWHRPADPKLGPSRLLIISAIVVGGVLIALARALPQPHHVPRLTIENPTDYSLLVETSNNTGNGWVPAAIVGPNTSVEARELVDQGDTWALRFRGQGRDGGTDLVTRDQLEAADWSYSIPTDVNDRLAEAGAPASPGADAGR
jgi:hypothetical protein